MDIKEKIKSQIKLNKEGIRLDKFINNALYKKNGYYYNKKPIGRKFDFITAPEVSQMFGEIIGLYLLYTWQTKIKKKFNLIELGPGKGTLFNDIINTVSNYPFFLNQAKITFVEINKSLIELQKNNIKKFNLKNIKWEKEINFKSSIPSLIYSNEFFDCFPVRQFILKKFWYEKYVHLNKLNNFYMKDKIVNNKKLISYLDLYTKEKLLEVSFERNKYFEKICKHIKEKGGIFITVDYGYFKKNKNFTLQAIQNHKFSHIFEGVGDKDISSHVNFSDFIDIAEKNKLRIEECCSQKDFLFKYGIIERKNNLLNLKNSEKIESEFHKLTSPKEMGELFKFLIVSKL